MKVKERHEIKEKYKWDLSIVYKNNAEWEKDYSAVSKALKGLLRFKGKMSESSDSLLRALKKKDEISRKFEKLASYAIRKSDEDTRNDENAKLKSKIFSLGAEFSEIASFFEPELILIGKGKIKKFINENDNLKVYRHYLDNVLRFKDHTLSVDEERIIASASEMISSPDKIHTILNNADIKFGNIKDEKGNVIELTKGNYGNYISSQDREVRKTTFMTLYQSYKDLKNTFAEILAANIKAVHFISKNKKFKNPLEMSLFRNKIDTSVYDNVINVVNKHLDNMYKYIEMKKKVLKLDEMHIYDFYVDLIKEYDIEYKYEDAVELIFNALKPLGEDYATKARKVFEERWIDVYENKGKLSGAYSSFGYDTPPYILLNYNGKLNSVSTIIHELGHSMHSYYASLIQPYVYHEYSIFVAEIASNVNEMLLNMYMQDNAKNKQEKLSLINDFLESIKGSIYRQVMFAEFEKIIYELEGDKQPLTENIFSEIYFELNKKYYGDNIVLDDEIRYEWMRIPHFYYQFYVYQYATGLTAAFYIARDLYKGKPGMREKYLNFLASGSSDYPLALLKKLGINMTSEEPMNRILEYFGEQIDEFNRLINEK